MSKPILVYDISMCPMSAGLDMEKVLKIYQEQKLVIYDSTENNYSGNPRQAPTLFDGEGVEIKSIDLGTTPMNSEEVKKLIE